LAVGERLPTIYGFREHVDAGGLMSYGANYPDQFRRAGGYVDKILRGAKPGELPVEQPTKFDLVINLTTAKALGLDIPADPARPRRRGDRIVVLFAAVHMSLPGTNRTCQPPRLMSAYGGTSRHGARVRFGLSHDPDVWSGRALQEDFADLADVRSCINVSSL
jgi:hypothetical protein